MTSELLTAGSDRLGAPKKRAVWASIVPAAGHVMHKATSGWDGCSYCIEFIADGGGLLDGSGSHIRFITSLAMS